jgi:hypothetical protein
LHHEICSAAVDDFEPLPPAVEQLARICQRNRNQFADCPNVIREILRSLQAVDLARLT